MSDQDLNIRTKIEEFEEKYLSKFACRTRDSSGRASPEKLHPYLTCFQVDKDRILHSEAFRKLKHKTQVFLSPLEDYFRTRMTHTLAVSQIATTIGQALFLNTHLIEAIALGHDLGHTPFGHQGEKALNSISETGFKHNIQSVRIVEVLEGGTGLNLTHEVRQGILTHSKGSRDLPEVIGQLTDESTLEEAVVRISDSIAYINHDIDDAIVSGLITPDNIPSKAREVLGNSYISRIDTMIRSIIKQSAEKARIAWSSEVRDSANILKDFLYKEVYPRPEIQHEMDKADKVLRDIFKYLKEDKTRLEKLYRGYNPDEVIDQSICDFISSLSDDEMIRIYEKIFIPEKWIRL